MIRPWSVQRSTELAQTPIFRLTTRTSTSPTGRAHDFYVLEAPEWVNVVPLLEDQQVLMIRQYRHGRQETSLEIPGGMVDPTDPDPAAAAGRELWEETGYAAGAIEQIGVIAPNPAIQDNRCHSFLATGLHHKGGQPTDTTEEVEVQKIPLSEIPALIQRGEICHALVVVAFCFLLRLQPPRPCA